MCGRYSLHADAERLVEQFRIRGLVDLKPRFNIAPSQQVPAVREGPGGRELALLRWGLVPFWAKETKTGYSMINARAETVASKPAFRAAYRQRRCLIPADGFYEWKAGPHGKQPYHIRLRDGVLFALAGLWERWQGEEGQAIESCAIIVTEANELIRPIHDRMPVILDVADYETWLDIERFESQRLGALLKPFPADRMEAYPVSTRVNSPQNDDETCTEPLRPD